MSKLGKGQEIGLEQLNRILNKQKLNHFAIQEAIGNPDF
jgi:hypothetical protein